MSQISKRRPGEALGGMPVADPRPQVVGDKVRGARCGACGYPTAPAAPWCPVCQNGEQNEAEFGPQGVVWSSTIVHIPVGDWRPPYALAYVDLVDGPRVLAHLEVAAIVPPGTAVRIVGAGEDVVVRVEADGASPSSALRATSPQRGEVGNPSLPSGRDRAAGAREGES